MKGSPILAFILLLGLLLQSILFYIAHVPKNRILRGDEHGYHLKAVQIASGKFPPQDFVWPPLYQYVIGGIYAVLGSGRLSVELFQTLLFFLSAFIFYRLILFSGLGGAAGYAGFSLFLLDPQIASFAQYFWPEILHLFLNFLMLALLFLTSTRRLLSLFCAGVSLGAAILTKSLMIPFVPVLLVAAGFRAPDPSLQSRLKGVFLFISGLLLFVLPLIVYNGIKHQYWGVADAASFNLWLGLKGDLYAAQEFKEYRQSSDQPLERNRIIRQRISDKVGQEGIWNILRTQLSRQYFRLFNKGSFLIEQFPGRRWARGNSSPEWLLNLLTYWSYVIYGATLILASIGIFQMRWPVDFKRCALPGLFILYNLALFLFFYAKTRYRIPMLPALIFFGAIAIYYFLQHKLDSVALPKFITRLAAGMIVACVLLYFAFGSET
jgi:4-amino-4-deoxy-L-arabinose transferase-like glycosyltransferase